MNHLVRYRRWAAAIIAMGVVVALVGLLPRFGFSVGTPTPLWNERPLDVSPSTVMVPNWVELAKRLKPAVVNVSTKRVEEGQQLQSPFGNDDPFQQFFKQFFGKIPPQTVRSLGSGFIINSAGYIVTNNHVVDGASEIRVKLSDGREFPGKVIGRDSKTDLALLKIDTTGLPVVPLGDSDDLPVGTPVMAIGNPFGLAQTVTTGIVSATGRVIGEGPYDDFIQTDASINPGNSGGPLINARGQAVGINTAIYSQTGGSVGIGFAIPIDHAKSIVTQLAKNGHVTRGWLGVAIQPLTPDLAKSFKLPDDSGALVASVLKESPAMRAGVKPGDVITEYDGRKVVHSGDLPRLVADTPVGRRVPIIVTREGKAQTLEVTIAQLKENPEQTARAEDQTSLGLQVEALTPELANQLGLEDTRGVVVRNVKDPSPAADAGIQPGDVVVEVDHHPIASVGEMKRAVAQHSKGTPLLVLLHRKGASLYVALAS